MKRLFTKWFGLALTLGLSILLISACGEDSSATPHLDANGGTIRLSDNGKILELKTGNHFLLWLEESDGWFWTAKPDDTSILSYLPSTAIPKGAQSYFIGNKAGTTTLTATARCGSTNPACPTPAYSFKVQVMVK